MTGRCFFIILIVLFFACPIFAEDALDKNLTQEIETLKEKIWQVEDCLMGIQEESMEYSEQHYHSVKGLDDRIKVVEKQVKERALPKKWSERLSISGLIEVDANYESMDFNSPTSDDMNGSDIITLATVELGLDANIGKHVLGHVLFLWEEDNTEPVDIDEGFISIDGWEKIPLYINAGRMYVPFGNFKSHFLSDPLTLEIGETRESAVRAGFINEIFDISVSLFNGDINELAGENKIETIAANVKFTLPEGLIPDFSLNFGLSYISNIADSNGLKGEISAGLVDNYVSGMGFFVTATIKERILVEFEYLGATDYFTAGELSFDGGTAYKPKTYNFEFAWMLNNDLELGVKFEGGDDLGDFLPVKQYGCVVNYNIFESTSIGIEYLHGEYENKDERDLITAQFTIEF